METFGRLNDHGIRKFKGYILSLKAGGKGVPPVHLCYDRETSDALSFKCEIGDPELTDRVEMGKALKTIIADNGGLIRYDGGFWSAMALLWFDKICPPDNNGDRTTLAIDRYIFDGTQLKANRHIIWGPWWVVSELKDDGEYFLRPPAGGKDQSLSYYGEIMNRFAGNQKVALIPAVVKFSRELYEDADTKAPKKGLGREKGSPAHFVRLLKQFELTYDFHNMSAEALRGLFPDDFKRWDKA